MSTTMTEKDADLDTLLMEPEIQQSLTTLLQELPRLATMIGVLGKVCDLGKEVLTDGDLMGGIEDRVRDTVGASAQGLYAAVQEAKRRADQDCTQIGVFGLLRLLKEPTVQRSLRFVQALCAVMTEQNARKKRC